MRDQQYVARLHRHLSDYREKHLKVPAGVWGSPPRAYGHVLPREAAALNIVDSLRTAFWQEQQAKSWRLHQYFHHLSSSQALAFNVFFPLYPRLHTGYSTVRNLLGIGADSPAVIEFEVVLPNGDGTNIDVLITEPARRTVIEVKLTEASFGSARQDARHLRKLETIYLPLLRGRLKDSALEPNAFFRDYQLFRNLAQLRPATDDSVVLLLPRAREKLWRFAQEWCSQLGAVRAQVRVVALEDLVAAAEHDARAVGHAVTPFREVSTKYLGMGRREMEPEHG